MLQDKESHLSLITCLITAKCQGIFPEPFTRRILLLGSGYVARPCAEYVLRRPENHLTVGNIKTSRTFAACRRLNVAEALASQFPQRATAISVDVTSQEAIDSAVSEHDLVIRYLTPFLNLSLIPYTHHPLVIRSAIKFKKHMVTTSYISPTMMEFDTAYILLSNS